MVYIARKHCGCVIAAVVDLPQTQAGTADDVSEWIRFGLTIERVTLEQARAQLTFNCHHEPQGIHP